ncbi:Rieske (2Fe-2S) protein [Mesobaculum littorinae]|uniref:Rieske (2Fe-2S) protein n=1 Tax=Mesobaculum littorinae TaxID=2486419 RepID=A0A438AHN4_9RHOB|nr:Rieske (2Fe-2S) protein [Mesobaculum littorinae]RVV98135.1 Rieske (2Fe-2S) protein [Mesobaculum littorinae]
MGRHVICRVDEIPEGKGKRVDVEGRSIAIFNRGDGRFSAISNTCPHEGAELCWGKIAAFADATGPGQYTTVEDREMVRCPWHGWEFDLETGRSYCDPKRVRVKAFDVSVDEATGMAEGPYKVDTYDVETEGRYVVLTI